MSRVTGKLQHRYEVLTGQAREMASRGVHEEADSRLQEALGVARQLAEAGEDARRKQAEIDALRGKLEFTQVHGASAVCYLENALGKYIGLFSDPKLASDEGLIRDFTQLLIDNAGVMMACGDPALAAASADSAWRLAAVRRQVRRARLGPGPDGADRACGVGDPRARRPPGRRDRR